MNTTLPPRRTSCVLPALLCLVLMSSSALFPSSLSATSLRVKDGGTPGVDCDCVAIQPCLDAASPGDTVLVAPGIYDERHPDPTGTECCVELRTGVTLLSEGGRGLTTIDAGEAGRVVYGRVLNSGTRLIGFTLRGGDAAASGPAETRGGGLYLSIGSPTVADCSIRECNADDGGGVFLENASPTFSACLIEGNTSAGYGGGIDCRQSSTPQLIGCVLCDNYAATGGGGLSCRLGSSPLLQACDLLANTAGWYGGGVFSKSSTPILQDCLLAGNEGAWYGGGIQCYRGSPAQLTGCTFTGNGAFFGGGISCEEGCSPTIDRTIVSFSTRGEGIYTYDELSEPYISCNDVFGNEGGNYGGYLADRTGEEGNISLDPIFCRPDAGDYTLSSSSPCVEGFGCGLMGARGVGCSGASSVPGGREGAARSWGFLKALYR